MPLAQTGDLHVRLHRRPSAGSPSLFPVSPPVAALDWVRTILLMINASRVDPGGNTSPRYPPERLVTPPSLPMFRDAKCSVALLHERKLQCTVAVRGWRRQLLQETTAATQNPRAALSTKAEAATALLWWEALLHRRRGDLKDSIYCTSSSVSADAMSHCGVAQ